MRVSVGALLLVLVACFCCSAQQKLTPSADASASGTNSTGPAREQRTQLGYLRRARQALADYLSTLPADSEDYRKTQITIKELDSKLQNLTVGTAENTTSATAETNTGNTPPDRPAFSLAVPAKGRTNLSTETTLTWTEDRNNGAFQDPPLYDLKKFRVVVATDKNLTQPLVDEDVPARSAAVTKSSFAPKGIESIETFFTIPANTLEPGTTYYWQVFAVYIRPGQTTESQESSDTAPSYFITTLDPFRPLIKRGFSLQRSLDSKDPTEGAQFSFLKTFDNKTVFSTDFAFFWDSPSFRFANDRGFVWFRPAVQGKLTSDDSLAEDAWRFSGSAVIDYNFIKVVTDEHNRFTSGTDLKADRKLIDSLYFELGANLESDQGFDTKKLSSRFYFSPSSRKLAIGTATGEIESPFQFVWRPSVEFNAGHTFKVGDSAEIEKTVLRFVPKVRMTLYTRGLSRLLKIADSDFFLENTFYYLPKEKVKTRHNFFTSGFELFVVKNFGFGLTYKNGESAPKFKMVRSFGGTLTVRFGP